MAFVSIGGESIHYERSGGDGAPLLLVHGSGGCTRHWPGSLRRSRTSDVVSVDLPGHGRSGGKGRSRVEDYADVVAALAETLGLKEAAVAGHSLGGAVALVLGLRRPGWLVRLVLVGTGARLRVTPEILDLVLTDFPAAVEQIARWAFGPRASRPMVAAFCKGLLETGPGVVHGDYSACNRFDVMDRVHGIRLPSLVICAAQDRLTPVKYGAYLRDHIPGAKMAVLEGAGHMMGIEQEKIFVDCVRRFVAP